MNIRQLELFCAVATEGGFTKAAEVEATSQPAVSIAVGRLEKEFGATLFLRGRRSVALTAEGKALLRHAQAILTSIDASQTEIRALMAGEVGRVSLGVPPMLAGHTLPPLVSAFLDQRPGVSLCIVQQGAEHVREAVMGGELDLGLIAGWRQPEGLEIQLLRPQAIVAWVSSDSPLARRKTLGWECLLDQPLVMFPRSYFQRIKVEQVASASGRQPKIAVEAESVPLIGALVESGIGVATLLESVPPPAGITAVPISPAAEVPIALCRRQDFPLSAAANDLHRLFARALGESREPVRAI